jgi:conjugal transfer mating pair stabilization protein TraN
MADAIDDEVAAARTWGAGMRTDFMPTYDASSGDITVTDGAGTATSMSLNPFFGGEYGLSGPDRSDLEDAYGDDAALLAIGMSRKPELESEASSEAEAYRTMVSVGNIARPDLSGDPVWGLSEAVATNPDLFAGFSGCTSVPTVTDKAYTERLPDLRTCERSSLLTGSCTMEHIFEFGDPVPLPAPPSVRYINYEAWGGSIWSRRFISAISPHGVTASYCGRGCIRYTLTQLVRYWPHTHDLRDDKDFNARLRFALTLDPKEILSARVTRGTILLNGTELGDYRRAREDITEELQAADSHNVYLQGIVTKDQHNPYQAQFEIRWKTAERELLGDYWVVEPSCAAIYGMEDLCPGKVTVSCDEQFPAVPGGFDVGHSNTVPLGGFVTPPFPEVPEQCKTASISVDCSESFAGAMDCYIDAGGVERCHVNDGLNAAYDLSVDEMSNCRVYEEDPNCVYVGSQPIKGADLDADGVSLYREDIYDCGIDVVIDDAVISRTIDCGGAPIRCLGGECMDTTAQRSTKFTEVVAGLSVANEMAGDGQCPDGSPDTCELFTGEHLECKKAFFGIIDCCETPSGVSLFEYMELYIATRDLDDLMGTGYFDIWESPVTGAWDTIANGASDIYDTVTDKFFTSGAEAAGGATSAVGDLGITAAMDSMKQTAMNTAAEFVGTTFGADAGNLIFQKAGPGGGSLFDASGGMVGDAAFTAGFQQVLTVINWVMTIYSIVTILVSLIWECEEEEFEVGAKRELKLCHKVGSYCADDSLFGCIEKRESYCCFNSPLARIINQQVRRVGGIPWGDEESPDCSGLTVGELRSVDWGHVNLSEWIAILARTNNLPKASTLNMEKLTGEGSTWDLDDTTTRPDARERAMARQNEVLTGSGDTYNNLYRRSDIGASFVVPPPLP